MDTCLTDLREISSLASWTVSTYKPSCGVSALRHPSPSYFWQSDGPQPHLLNIHFFKLVAIVRLRIYLDFELDESYTPTRLVFCAGTSEYDLAEFAEWGWGREREDGVEEAGPSGWVDVPLDAVGGGEGEGEGGVLRCMVLQVRVCENHQNGKDTHVRGVQIFARAVGFEEMGEGKEGMEERRLESWAAESGIEDADWMGEPVLR